MFARGGDQVANGGKQNGRWLAPSEEVQENRDSRCCQSSQHPRVKKTNHAEREGALKASRSTTPNGVSVVTR